MLQNPARLKHLSIVVSALVLASCAPLHVGDAVNDRPQWQVIQQAEQTMLMPVPRGAARLICERQPDSTVVQRFTPGQELQIAIRNHRFIIPGNALDTVATFSMRVRHADQVEVLIHPRGEFAGFRQAIPATLMLGFSHCETPESLQRLRVRRYSYGGDRFGEELGGKLDPQTLSISVQSNRFSGYIIAQN